MISKWPLAAATSLLIALPAVGQGAQIDVPEDYLTIQDAIDAASPNDVIVVHGGTYDPIVIDKPLTLVGAPSAIIGKWIGWPDPPHGPPIVILAGPGYGTVTFVSMTIIGVGDGEALANSDPAIVGGGFDRLRILFSQVNGYSLTGAGGGSTGSSAIDTGVPLIFISDSAIWGGSTDSYNFVSPDQPNASPAIVAGDLVLLSSDVHGGSVAPTVIFNQPGPLNCDAIVGGIGGDCVHANHLYIAGSMLYPGKGAKLYDDDDMTLMTYCQMPDGQAIVAGEVTTIDQAGGSDPLSGPGLMQLGKPWNMLLPAPYWTGFIVVGTECAPKKVGAYGWLFVDPATMSVLPIMAGQMSTVFGTTPSDQALVGLTITLQLYGGLLSRPAMTAVAP